MIEVTSFLLKHLYELMADNYNASNHASQQQQQQQQQTIPNSSSLQGSHTNYNGSHSGGGEEEEEEDSDSGNESTHSQHDNNNDDTNNQRRQQWNCAGQTDVFDQTDLSQRPLIRTQQIRQEQETNQQIVAFLTNNHLPDLACDTFIELLFICVFLAISWIFVMIVQLHCHQLQQPARVFYCNTKLLASLMYCNNKSAQMVSI